MGFFKPNPELTKEILSKGTPKELTPQVLMDIYAMLKNIDHRLAERENELDDFQGERQKTKDAEMKRQISDNQTWSSIKGVAVIND